MLIALKIVLHTIGTASLISLSLYIYFLARGNSAILLLLHPIRSTNRMPFRYVVFFSLSAIGLVVCLYEGASTMLSWIPSAAGFHNEDGGFIPINIYFSGLLSVAGGVALSDYSKKSYINRILLNESYIRNQGNTKILRCNSHPSALNTVRDEFSEEIKILKTKIPANIDINHPNERIIEIYQNLIRQIDNAGNADLG